MLVKLSLQVIPPLSRLQIYQILSSLSDYNIHVILSNVIDVRSQELHEPLTRNESISPGSSHSSCEP